MEFLRESTENGLPDVLWVDGASRGYFSVREVVTSGYTAQYVDTKNLCVREDLRDKETTLLAYYDREGNFLVDQSGEFDHGGKP